MIASGKTLVSRKAAWLALLLIALTALLMVIVPVWLIQPFAPQTQRGLALSYALRRWSPLATLVGLAGALALIRMLWPDSRWWRRVIMLVVLAPLLPAVWFARQNHFEWMFR